MGLSAVVITIQPGIGEFLIASTGLMQMEVHLGLRLYRSTPYVDASPKLGQLFSTLVKPGVYN